MKHPMLERAGSPQPDLAPDRWMSACRRRAWPPSAGSTFWLRHQQRAAQAHVEHGIVVGGGNVERPARLRDAGIGEQDRRRWPA